MTSGAVRRGIGVAVICASLAAAVAAQQVRPDLAPLLAGAGVSGAPVASCRGELRLGHPDDVAVAVADADAGGRYVALMDGQAYELATYSGKPSLSCYTVREADRLTADIARSDTINGRVTAEWDGAVVCGFIEPTIAVCWQYARERKGFVRVGGWMT